MLIPNLILILLALIFLWLLGLSYFIFRLTSHYQGLVKDVSKKDLLSSLNHLISKTESNDEELQTIKGILDKEIKANREHFQRLGFKRFNPFTDTGGNQSFILSLLDENHNGIVISSLHSRENTRVYAKRIEKGESLDQELSKDEKEVVKQSLK